MPHFYFFLPNFEKKIQPQHCKGGGGGHNDEFVFTMKQTTIQKQQKNFKGELFINGRGILNFMEYVFFVCFVKSNHYKPQKIEQKQYRN